MVNPNSQYHREITRYSCSSLSIDDECKIPLLVKYRLREKTPLQNFIASLFIATVMILTAGCSTPSGISSVQNYSTQIVRAQSSEGVDPAFMQMMEKKSSSKRKSWHDEKVKTVSAEVPEITPIQQPLQQEIVPDQHQHHSHSSMNPLQQQSQHETPMLLKEAYSNQKKAVDFAPKSLLDENKEASTPSLDEPLADVLIEGNATIPVSALSRYIKTRPGRTATIDQIRDDIRSLYSTKWFFTVEPVYRRSEKGTILVFKVTELPILRSVEYAGNEKIKDNILAGITGLKPLHAFSVAANRESVRRIRDHYKEKGYLYAEVTLDKGDSPDDRDVIFRINEGPKVKVASITFKGNKDISSGVLKMRLSTKKRILWKFGGQYDPNTISSDIAAIKKYYHNIGYFDIQASGEKKLSEDRSTVAVTFTIDEGERYKIRKIILKGNQLYSREQLLEDFKLTEGKFYNARDLAKDVNGIQDKYGMLGRLFAKVNPGTKFTQEQGVLDLVYDIDEDRVYRIGMINVNIRGQFTHTKETVALNQLLVAPGDLADPEKIRKSRARLGGSPVWERAGADGPGIDIRPVTNPTYLARNLDPDPDPDPPVIRGSNGYFGTPPTMASSTYLPTGNRIQKSYNELVLTNLKSQKQQEPAGRVRVSNAIPGAGHTLQSHVKQSPAVPQSNTKQERYFREYRKERAELDQLLMYQPLDFNRSQVFFENAKPFLTSIISRKTESPVIRGQNVDQYAAPPDLMQHQHQPGREMGPPILTPELPPGYVDLDLNVTEARTGRFMVGASVNSDSGVFGNIVLEEQNFDLFAFPRSWRDVVDGYAFRGDGQQFRLEATPGNLVSRYLASWTNPHFLDTDYSLGVSGFYYQRFFRDWNEQRTGGRISIGKLLTRELSFNTAIRLERVNISRLRLNAPSLVPTLGDNFLGTGKVTLGYDTRDSASLATEGFNLQSSIEQAFADYNFTKAELQGSRYFTTYQRPDGAGKHVLSFRGNLGWTSNDTPAFERFYAGGFQTFRGFRYRSVGPLEPPNLGTNGAQVGGNFQMLGTAEYMLPIMASETVRFVAFTDFGTIERNVSLENFRVTVGGGLRITVPQMGPVPIALDWAFPVVKENTDTRQLFSFYIGLTR